MRIIEKFIVLRSLNYIRIRRGYYLRYNVIIPGIMTILVMLIVSPLDGSVDIFGETGLITKFSQILAILSPFFVAALAAVATFSANERFDKPPGMISPPRIIFLEKGKWKERTITLRHFLSMLFDYCAVVSFTLFFVTILTPIVAKRFSGLSCTFPILPKCIFVAFMFILFNMVTATLLGMYYLSDRMHRTP